MEKLLKDHYRINVLKLTKMEGYDSINFKVETKSSIYVLKQYKNTPENNALLIAENSILNKLRTLQGYEFSSPIKSKSNGYLVFNKAHIFRLLTYLEGKFLAEVPHTPLLLTSLGKFLGELDNTIHKEYQSAISAKKIEWDLQYFQKNFKFLNDITDVKDRNLVAYFFLQFNEQVYPLQHQLRSGIIHNDANDWNVLTRNGEVSGLIDFGDMCHSWIINEIAVAVTYMMMGQEDPLSVAEEIIKGYCSAFYLEEIELKVLYYLVAARLCTSVCNSAVAKKIKPDSEYILISEKPAWQLLRHWLKINPVKAEDTFRLAAGYQVTKKKKIESELIIRKENLGKSFSLSYNKPIHMNRSAFQYMYDSNGNTYLDAYNNIMLVGHCHPKVVSAGQKALAQLNTNTRYVYEILQKYSEKLLAKFPAQLNKVFFVNSGSAAGDLALRMALHYTKKGKILALEHAYHGNTKLTFDASHYKYASSKGDGQKDFILKTPMPNAFKSGFDSSEEAGQHYAKITNQTITENKNHIAAFIAEPMVGCGGQVPLAKEYLKLVYPEIRAQGGICISDEVQVGFGRLGDNFWGFEMHEVVPDMVILGKPMGNGHPLGAVVTTAEIAQCFEKGPEFFSSFGGNPVSCAIGLAVLNVIEEENLQQHAKLVGDYFKKQLNILRRKYTCIADVRGSGLFLGIELLTANLKPDTILADSIKNYLRENNLLTGTDGPYNNVLKVKPPLSFQCEDVDTFIDLLDAFLKKSI